MEESDRFIANDNDYDDDYYIRKEAYKRKCYRKKKRRRRLKMFMLVVLFSLSLIAGHVLARVEVKLNTVLNGINRDTATDLSTVAVNKENLTSDKRVRNILLIGSDKRVEWTQTGRSDSVMIGTLDLKNRKLKITSLMRDMYLQIPGHDDNRFNAAYSYGGVGLLYQTIATNFGLQLDGYVVVDFDAFKNVIDTLGGVSIHLTDAEQEYLTTAYKKGTVTKLKKGENIMNGKQALAYTRIRQDADGDFGRTKRQRKVLQAIFTKVKSMSYSELMELTEGIMPYITTDLSNGEIINYMKEVVMLGTTEINQMRIPVDHSYTNDRIRNMAVLIPDMQINKKALNDFIFEE